MEIIAIKTKIFKEKENLYSFIFNSVKRIKDKDIIVITSKIVSLSQGRVSIILDKEKFFKKEKKEFIKGKYYSFAKINGDFVPGGGIDKSNANEKMILFPKNPFKVAFEIYKEIKKHYKLKEFGVLITDSRSRPLRNGTTGITIGYYGFLGIKSYKKEKDIFNRKMLYTRVNVADSLASSAVLLMGEGSEKTPIAIIKNAPVEFSAKKTSIRDLIISPEEDYYKDIFLSS